MFVQECIFIFFFVICYHVVRMSDQIATSSCPPVVPEQLSDQTRAMALSCLRTASDDRPTAKELLRLPCLNT